MWSSRLQIENDSSDVHMCDIHALDMHVRDIRVCDIHRFKIHVTAAYCRLEFICEKFCKNTVAKNFNVYIVIIVVMNFRKKNLIAKFSHPSFLPFSQIFSSAK